MVHEAISLDQQEVVGGIQGVQAKQDQDGGCQCAGGEVHEERN